MATTYSIPITCKNCGETIAQGPFCDEICKLDFEYVSAPRCEWCDVPFRDNDTKFCCEDCADLAKRDARAEAQEAGAAP